MCVARKNGDRWSKDMLVTFPFKMEVPNSVYSPLTTDNEIKMKILPYNIAVEIGQRTYTLLKCRVVWKVHIVEEEERVVENEQSADAAGPTHEDALNDALQGLQF